MAERTKFLSYCIYSGVISALIGADSLDYLPLDALRELAGCDGYCSACFSGDYPTDISGANVKNRFEQRL